MFQAVVSGNLPRCIKPVTLDLHQFRGRGFSDKDRKEFAKGRKRRLSLPILFSELKIINFGASRFMKLLES